MKISFFQFSLSLYLTFPHDQCTHFAPTNVSGIAWVLLIFQSSTAIPIPGLQYCIGIQNSKTCSSLTHGHTCSFIYYRLYSMPCIQYILFNASNYILHVLYIFFYTSCSKQSVLCILFYVFILLYANCSMHIVLCILFYASNYVHLVLYI